MLKIVLFAALVGCVYSGNSACMTTNHLCYEVYRMGDTDRDGALTETELETELLVDWNLSNGTSLSKHDFVSNWVARYHDHHSTANEFFDRLDANNDGHLELAADILPLIKQYDTNGDGIVQYAEFCVFMHSVHPDAIHGHGCH